MEYTLIFLGLIILTGFAMIYHKLSEKSKQPDVNVTVNVPEFKITPNNVSHNHFVTDGQEYKESSFKVNPIEYMNRTKITESNINVESKRVD